MPDQIIILSDKSARQKEEQKNARSTALNESAPNYVEFLTRLTIAKPSPDRSHHWDPPKRHKPDINKALTNTNVRQAETRYPVSLRDRVPQIGSTDAPPTTADINKALTNTKAWPSPRLGIQQA